MTTQLQPWHVAFAWAVGWVNRQQNVAIEYLRAENRTLREHVGGSTIDSSSPWRNRRPRECSVATKGSAGC